MRPVMCILILSLFSCKQDNLYGINTDTRLSLLVDKKWQTVAMYVKSPEGTIIRDNLALFPDYRKDDYYLFRADSSFELNDHVNLQPGSLSPVIDSGSWTFTNQDQFIVMSGGSELPNLSPLKINVITQTDLTLQAPITDGTQHVILRAMK